MKPDFIVKRLKINVYKLAVRLQSYYLDKESLIKPKIMSETKRLVIEMNEDLKRRFQEKVESEGRSMKYVLTQYIKEYTYDRKEKK